MGKMQNSNTTIIVGLGNPGEKYKKTRHNLGFLALDKIREDFTLPDWEHNNLFLSHTSKGKISKKQALLAKPQTFMNNSGKAVKKLVSSFKLQASSLIVIHDDIDIEVGKIKIAQNRGPGGHKGIESIISHIGNKNFTRIRCGIKPPTRKPASTDRFVLQNFTTAEQKIITETLLIITKAIETILLKGTEKAMNEFN